MEIKPHIHLTNWLDNAGGEKKRLIYGTQERRELHFKKSIPHYQPHLSCESIVH